MSSAAEPRPFAESCAAGSEPRFDDIVMDHIIHLLGGRVVASCFLPVCRRWFHTVVCHPISFRSPVQAWHLQACRCLDEQLARIREPPEEGELEDLRVGLAHADEELKLTELSASFPAGVTVMLLRYARRLSWLLQWINAARMTCEPNALERQRFVQGERLEFRRRVVLLTTAVNALRGRLPDPELPMRWARWFEQQGELTGLPKAHCSRYQSQREQVAEVWANNKRTFLSTEEHVVALEESLEELPLSDEEQTPEEEFQLAFHDFYPTTEACSLGIAQLCERHCGRGVAKATSAAAARDPVL